MTDRALIFGAGGQDARYLCGLLREAGVTPVGVGRASGDARGDVADFAFVEALVRDRRPSHVFHLAANSSTRHDAVLENHATIATGTVNVLEAVKRHAPDARVFVTGSGLQFKNEGRPISERDPFDAGSAYAASRIAAAYAARYYRSLGVRAYVGYLFHHDSPLRKAGHVSQLVARAARRIAAGSGETLELGDLSVRKECGFAGDIAAGILALVGQDAVFEATIGTGEAHTIQRWVEVCFARVGLDWRAHVRTKAGFKAEYPVLVSDPSTLRGLGWRPAVDVDRLADLMVSAADPGTGEAGVGAVAGGAGGRP